MSESVRDLLVRGIAAAKTGKLEDKQEAHFYLDWVLRSPDADAEQQASAWLWLSEIEDDPKKKRECLENVIAIDPANGPARRGLAILDGRLRPEDLIDQGQTVEPVKPAAKLEPSAVRRYVCPKCGGRMSFDAALRALTCSYCGNRLPEDQAIQQGALIDEQDFFATLPTAKASRWELPTERTLTCGGCGATVALPPLQLTGTCPFCGAAFVVSTQTSQELIQPEAVLPFHFDAAEALKRIRAWIDAQHFRPGDLDERVAIVEPRGLYLPFWTFNLGGTLNWHALVAERQTNQTVWLPRDDVYLVYQDNLLIPASHSLPKELADRLLDFNIKALVPYSPDLIAAWSAEVYQVPLADASLVARQVALHSGQAHVQNTTLAGERYRDFFMSSAGLIVESYKLVLLPMWMTSYHYKNEAHLVAVNGQTGTVAGSVPRSGLQKALAGLFGDK